MSIDNVGSASTLSTLSRVSALSGTASSTTALSTDDPDSVDSQISLSDPAQLLNKLQDLESTDPSKAKDVLHSLAGTVRDQASTSTGADATQLNALADKLDKAADSGDLSGIQPQHAGKAHHHHHHGGGGGGGGGVTPAASSTNPTQLSGADPAAAAYAQQQADAARDQSNSLWKSLNATFDALTKDPNAAAKAITG